MHSFCLNNPRQLKVAAVLKSTLLGEQTFKRCSDLPQMSILRLYLLPSRKCHFQHRMGVPGRQTVNHTQEPSSRPVGPPQGGKGDHLLGSVHTLIKVTALSSGCVGLLFAYNKKKIGLGMAVRAFKASTWWLRKRVCCECDASLGCTVRVRLVGLSRRFSQNPEVALWELGCD